MSDDSPRVSIGVPVYNGQNYLGQALESLLKQTFADFEVIISDNGSTDATPEICREFVRRDNRVSYHRSDINKGIAWNYNHAFKLSRGAYFKWADHDDLCAPAYLERCVQVLEARQDIVLCDAIPSDIDQAGQILTVYDHETPTDDAIPHRRLYHLLTDKQDDRKQITGLIRSSALRRTPLFATYPTADLVLLASLVLLGSFHRVRENLFFYRRHVEQTVRLARFERYARLEPSKRGRITLPEWEAFGGLLKCVAGAPLSPSERLRCYVCVLRWPVWHRNWMLMGKDLARATLMLARIRRPASAA